MEIKIHEYQISILRELLFKPKARFRDLKKVDIENDHFTFHLNHLIKEGLIEKTVGRYSLTTKGKEFANRMDTETLVLEKQAKLGVSIHAESITGGKRKFLVHQRLKEPFYGWYGFVTGKIKWGETPEETAKRELLEETGLNGKFELKGIVHYLHLHNKTKELLEDKYFFIYKVTKPEGNLKESIEEGKNIWMTEKEYRKLNNTFATFDEVKEVLNSKKVIYVERKRFVDNY